MSLIQRVPWTVQPQIAVGVNWANPITRGLQLLQVPVGTSKNLVDGSIATTYAITGVVGGAPGLGYGLNGALDGLQNPKGSQTYANAGGSTLLAWFKATSAATQTLISNNAGSVVPLNFGLDVISTVFRVSAYRACATSEDAYKFASTTTILAGKDHLITWGYGNNQVGNNPTTYVDGVVQAISTSFSTGTQSVAVAETSASVSVGANSGGGSGRFNGNIYIAATWNRALTDTEHLSLASSPWQLFAPLPRRLWAPAAGAAPAFIASSYNIRQAVQRAANW